MPKKNILILGAGGNAAMSFIRSLRMGTKDFSIIGCDTDRFSLAGAMCDVKYLVRQSSKESKVKFLTEICKRHEVALIHAQPDAEVRFLLENYEHFSEKVFPHSLELWERFADKLGCQSEWAKSVGDVRTAPLNSVLQRPELFDHIGGGGRVWFRAIRGAGSRASLPVESLAQAKSWAEYWISSRGMRFEDFMLCEYLPGEEYAVQTFWLNGTLVHSQARERLVYFFGSLMPSGQSSTPAVARTVDLNDVYQVAHSAITAIDPTPHGIYCVDLKRNAHGRVIPMEVNYGRFFTTSDFFASIGVNTPLAYVQAFFGEAVAPQIRTVREPLYWLRGLDKEPRLFRQDELSPEFVSDS